MTAAETAELAIALEAIGDAKGALDLLDQIQLLRDPSGAYWTGWQYVTKRHYPDEQSSYTSAAIVLAADALCGATAGSSIFRDAGADPAAVEPGRRRRLRLRAARPGRRRRPRPSLTHRLDPLHRLIRRVPGRSQTGIA